MSDVLIRAAKKRQIALNILAELSLLEKWTPFGRPVIVGAVAYDLVVSPDIDLEIYCPKLKIEHGFSVISDCALHPGVTKARFSNKLSERDKALYWQLRYRTQDGEEWKIDMWSAPEDYNLPRSEGLVEPMKMTLTPQTRMIILQLKEERVRDPTLICPSVDLYRAVLDDGVRTVDQLHNWLKVSRIGALIDWKPAVSA